MRLYSTISAARDASRSGVNSRKQRNRIMVQLPPANGIQVAKQIDDVGMPGPPQVVGKRDALVVQGFVTDRAGRRTTWQGRDSSRSVS